MMTEKRRVFARNVMKVIVTFLVMGLSVTALVTKNPASIIGEVILMGIIVSWWSYQHGLLALEIPEELPSEEKNQKMAYHHQQKWHETHDSSDLNVGRKSTKVVLALFITWNVFTVLTGIMNELWIDKTPAIGAALHGMMFLELMVFFILLFILLVAIVSSISRKKFQERGFSPSKEQKNLLIILLGAFTYVLFSILGLGQGFIKVPSIIIGLFMVPVVIAVSLIEGKFYFLFGINQYWRARNWDVLAGKQLYSSKSPLDQKITGMLERMRSLIAVLTMPIGLLSIIGIMIDLIRGHVPPDQPSFISELSAIFFTSPYPEFLSFLFLIGPLIVLFTRPFDFIATWFNQGLYELIASPWDLDTINQSFEKNNGKMFQFQQLQEGFHETFMFVSGGIMLLTGLFVGIPLLNLGHDANVVLLQAIFLLQGVAAVITLTSIISTISNLAEEKVTWIFARESHKHGINLLDSSFYGWYQLYLIDGLQPSESLRTLAVNLSQATSNTWALPWFLIGLESGTMLKKIKLAKNLSKDLLNFEEDVNHACKIGIEAYQKALSPEAVLLPRLVTPAWNNLGLLFMEMQHLEEAENAFRRALQNDSGDGRTWNNLGTILNKMGRFEEAEDAFQKAIRVLKDVTVIHAAWGNLGNLLMEVGKLREAKKAFLKALDFNPNDPSIWHQLGTLHEEMGQIKEAEKALRESLHLDPRNSSAWFQLGLLLKQGNKLQEAASAFQQAIRYNLNFTNARVQRGIVLLELGHHERAEDELLLALELDPTHVSGWYVLGAYFKAVNRVTDAIHCFERVVKLDPTIAEAWSDLAALKYQQGYLEEAEQILHEALECHPTNTILWQGLATILHRLARLEEAENALRQALIHSPHDATSWYNLALLHEEMGRDLEAEDAYRRATREDPSLFAAWYNLGILLQKRGQIEDSERAYREVIRLKPELPKPWLNVGLLLLDTNPQRSLEALKTYLNLMSDAPERNDILALIEYLEGVADGGNGTNNGNED